MRLFPKEVLPPSRAQATRRSGEPLLRQQFSAGGHAGIAHAYAGGIVLFGLGNEYTRLSAAEAETLSRALAIAAKIARAEPRAGQGRA